MGAQFLRVRPFKYRSGERLRTATARKNDKSRFRRRLRTHFFGPGPVFCRFWAPGGDPKFTQNRIRKQSPVDFLRPEISFLRFLRLGAFRKGPGTDFGLPGSLPNRISEGFSVIVRRGPPGSCRGLSGSAGTLPGYTVGLRCVLGIISGMA